jgi:LysR family glycine cleavage system transcriptional activator
LNLTRSAVSHQLRLLERELGFRLLNRVGTRIELTPQGHPMPPISVARCR